MLLEAANVHQRMATARKDFNKETNETFIEDLRNFMNTTLNEALKAKTKLEEVRLDLDSDKNSLKNAKNSEQKAKVLVFLLKKCSTHSSKKSFEFDFNFCNFSGKPR